jgi:hypothetical protein
MRFTQFLFLVICQLAVVSGVSAQDDAGADSGLLESLDPLAACMDACARRYELCVTDATIPACIANVPECHGLEPRTTEIMAAFCDACGRAAVGCEAAPVVAGSASGSDPDPSATGEDLPVVRRPTAAELERTALARARGICARQRGIWDAESAILMPDGTYRQGICHTPEGAELALMIRDEHEARAEADEELGRRITAERMERIEAIRLLDERTRERYFMQEDLINQMLASMERQSARLRCLELGAERVTYTSSAPTFHSEISPGHEGRWVYEGMRRVDYECPGPDARSGIEPVGSSARTRSASRESDPRAVDEHPTLFGDGWRPRLRLSLLGWIGFTPLHPTLAQMHGSLASTPVGLGFEATVLLPIYRGLYMEGGVGVTYDWPDFSPYATPARIWYHGGLAYYLVPEVSIGLGYLGTDRFRPTMQSAHSFHGAYLELSIHGRLRVVDGRIAASPDVNDPAVVFTIRGAGGASFRPAASTAADGLIQVLIGLEI